MRRITIRYVGQWKKSRGFPGGRAASVSGGLSRATGCLPTRDLTVLFVRLASGRADGPGAPLKQHKVEKHLLTTGWQATRGTWTAVPPEAEATSGEPRAASHDSRTPVPESRFRPSAAPTARGGQVRRLNGQPLRPRVLTASGAGVWVLAFHSALRTLNSFSRLTLRPQVSPGFRFSAPLLLIVYLSTAPEVIHNGVCPSVHIKFRSISIRIDQTATGSDQKRSKQRAFRLAHLNILGAHPLWR